MHCIAHDLMLPQPSHVQLRKLSASHAVFFSHPPSPVGLSRGGESVATLGARALAVRQRAHPSAASPHESLVSAWSDSKRGTAVGNHHDFKCSPAVLILVGFRSSPLQAQFVRPCLKRRLAHVLACQKQRRSSEKTFHMFLYLAFAPERLPASHG